MKKIWITGAEGHIGSALVALLDSIEYQILTTDINEVDITDINEVNHYMHINRPDVVINCASLTDVEYCEKNDITKDIIFSGTLIKEYSFTNKRKMMGHVWREDGVITVAAK